jgi:hypothetical protein
MAIFNLLKRFWESTDPKNDPDPGLDEHAPQISAQEFKQQKKALSDFVETTFRSLGNETAKKLAHRVTANFKPDADSGAPPDMTEALRKGLEGGLTGKSRTPYVFICDARYVEDTSIWISQLAQSFGVAECFSYDEAASGASPEAFFFALRQWLNDQGQQLVFIDSGGDEYCVFFIRSETARATLMAADYLGIKLSLGLS